MKNRTRLFIMAATDAGLTQLVVGVCAGYQLYGEEWLYMGRLVRIDAIEGINGV